MKDEIVATLSKQIASEFLKQPDRELDADEALISSGIIDSFSLVDLALFIEDTYGVVIDDSELNASTFDTLNELANLVIDRKE